MIYEPPIRDRLLAHACSELFLQLGKALGEIMIESGPFAPGASGHLGNAEKSLGTAIEFGRVLTRLCATSPAKDTDAHGMMAEFTQIVDGFSLRVVARLRDARERSEAQARTIIRDEIASETAELKERAYELSQQAAALLQPRHTCFLSYAHPTIAVADHLEVLLLRAGRRVLRDEKHAEPGRPIDEEMKGLVTGAREFIAIWDAHYQGSNWCQRELNLAIDSERTSGAPRVVIFCADGCAVPTHLAARLSLAAGTRAERVLAIHALSNEAAAP